MVIECKLSKAEMNEAFRMNLSGSFWLATILRSIRVIILIVVVVAVASVKILNHDSENWGQVAILLAFVLLAVVLYFWRIGNAIKKSAAKINTACDRMTLDGQGLTTANAGGGNSFVPWSQLHKWKEGKLVFTVGDPKGFRTIPKSAMSEMQVGEVRGILQSSIR